MIATAFSYPEEMVIEHKLPSDYIISHERNETLHLISNNSDRRHRSADDVMWSNDVLSCWVEYNKIRNLFSKINKFSDIDFQTFKNCFEELSEGLESVIPQGSLKATEVSVQDECLSNFYECDEKMIFINLFFEDDHTVVCQLNIKDKSGYSSFEGEINQIVKYLKQNLI